MWEKNLSEVIKVQRHVLKFLILFFLIFNSQTGFLTKELETSKCFAAMFTKKYLNSLLK